MEEIIEKIEKKLFDLWNERDEMLASLVPYDAIKEAENETEYQTYIDGLKEIKYNLDMISKRIGEILAEYDVE